MVAHLPWGTLKELARNRYKFLCVLEIIWVTALKNPLSESTIFAMFVIINSLHLIVKYMKALIDRCSIISTL